MSAKSDLYRYVKNAIMGGIFKDALDTEHYFEKIEEIKFMNFWNSELQQPETKDGFPVPAVFFEFNSSPNAIQNLKIAVTDQVATTKDNVQFILHFIGGKFRAESRDEDYLDLIDLGDTVFKRLNGKNFANCKNIHRVDEYQDIESTVLMDWSIVFECYLANIGETELTDANDPTGKVAAEIVEITLDPKPYIVKN